MKFEALVKIYCCSFAQASEVKRSELRSWTRGFEYLITLCGTVSELAVEQLN